MKATFNIKELLKELTILRNAVSKDNNQQILKTFLLSINNNKLDSIIISATDGEIYLESSCIVQDGAAGSYAIPAQLFHDIVKNEEDSSILLETKKLSNGTDIITLTGTQSKFEIQPFAAHTFPSKIKLPQSQIEISVSLMLRALDKVIIAAVEKESRYAIRGANLKVSTIDNTFALAATDGNRLAVAKGLVNNIKQDFNEVIPRKALIQLLTLLQKANPNDILYVSSTDNHIFFSIGNRKCTSRKLSTAFPDYSPMLNKTFEFTTNINKKELLKAIKIVSVALDEIQDAIKLKLSTDVLTIECRNNNSSVTSKKIISASWVEKEEYVTFFGSGYLLELLSVLESDSIKFQLSNPSAQSLVTETVDGLEYTHIIMTRQNYA